MFQQAVLGKCEGRMPPWHILIYIAFRSTLFTYLTLGSSLFFFFFLKWWVGKLRKKIQEVKNSEPCQRIFLTVFSGLPWKWTWSRERQKKQKTLAPGQTDACLLLRSGQHSRVSAHAACLQDDFMSYCCFHEPWRTRVQVTDGWSQRVMLSVPRSCSMRVIDGCLGKSELHLSRGYHGTG